jgi:hypothetical protein
MAANFDREDILRTWQIFRQPGEVLELRIPKAGRYKTISGYFNDPGALADSVIGLADEGFAGIYFTINPVKADLLARAANRYVKYAENTTSDADITTLHWLPIDLDAKRPAGISSTDEEHEAAISKAKEARRGLIDRGWPANSFILADSGNGAHLNAKIDLTNTPESVALVKECLEALDFLYSDEVVHVDTTSQNPARIWKLYGTMARKGDSTPERPHRLARLLEVPENLETVSREQLEALAAMLPEPEGTTSQAAYHHDNSSAFDPVAYCREHNLQVNHVKPWTDRSGAKCTVAVLEQCVFNPDHHLSAVIIGWPNGARSYRCRHRSCLDRHWKDAKAIIEPNRKAPTEEPAGDRSILEGLSDKIKEDPGIIYEPDYFQVLTEIYSTDPQGWARIKKIFLAHKVSVKDFVKQIKEAAEDTPIIETPFMVLEGGRLTEMVANAGAARFVVYDPATQAIQYIPEILQDGTRIIPPTSDEIFQKGYVTLPSEAEEYGTELELYRDIQKFIHKYLEVSPDYESIAAFYPMLTWVHDVMPVIAYLRAKGDWGVGKSRYLDVFRALCYRSISTTGAMSEAPIFRIMDRWKGTLIIDEGDFGKSRDSAAAMEKILVCGFERGKPIIRCNPNNPAEVNIFDPFGPKIVATRYGFKDKALESRCFTEIMKESIRTDVPVQLPYEFDEEARHLRNKLLMYRFRNREQVKQTSDKGKIDIDLSGLPKRIQQAARPLSVILANYPELLATLKAFLEVKSKALVIEASETTEGYLVRTMDNHEQMSNDGKIIVWDADFGGITELIKATSGNYKLTAALVRSRANSLGLKTVKSSIGGSQRRRITCEVPLFERLKSRYIPPAEDDTTKPDNPDSPDDIQGDPAQTRAIPSESQGDDRQAGERELTSGGDIDRPDRPDRPGHASLMAVRNEGDFEGIAESANLGKIDRPTPSKKKPIKEDPGLREFKAKAHGYKHICRLCGQHFDQPLVIAGFGGYICARCHREGPPLAEPTQADSQTKLGGEAPA